MSDLITFTPNDASREKYRALAEKINLKYMDEFFELWESQGEHTDAAREAGTMVAHALIDMAARLAIFGAECSGHEPVRDQWIEVCNEHFNRAITDVAEAFKDA